MRKIVLIIAAVVITVSLMGCNILKSNFFDDKNSKPNATLKDKIVDENDRQSYDGALMSYVGSTDTSLTVKIVNDTDSTWQSGNMRDYSLEMKKDGEWYTVEQIGELANTMELMIFSPGQELTHTFEFAARYGNLAPGCYRVVKSYWANATESSDAREFYLTCEFTVE
jgi:hypothetical protein